MKCTYRRAGWLPLILAGLLAAPLAAQAPEQLDQISWDVAGGDVGWCVQFLLEPKEAVKEMGYGYRPVAASAADGFHPAIKRAITDEPKFAEWVPAELCIWFVGSVATQGRTYVRGDKGVPLAVTWWGVAATSGESAWDGKFWMRMIGSNSYPLVRLMQVSKLEMDQVKIEDRGEARDPADQIYTIKFNGADIRLTGRFTADSTNAPAMARKASGVMMAPIQSMWTTDITMTPEKQGAISGSLQIFGGRGLAKALRASPIRLIGSAVIGGTGSARFIRTSAKRQ
jgi:hypothetical protein